MTTPPLNQPAADAAHWTAASLPTVGLVALVVIAVVGLGLWLLGGRLARVACVICGLAVGAAAGYVVGQYLKNQGAYVVPLVLGGAIAGALLAALLFRLWVAVVGAAILAAVVPAAVLIWQGAVTIPPPGGPGGGSGTPAKAAPAQAAKGAARGRGPSHARPAPGPEKAAAPHSHADKADEADGQDASVSAAYQRIETQLHNFYGRVAQRFAAQWNALDGSNRAVIYTGGIIGAAIGLGLGLVVPNLAAVLQTALVGAVMMVFAGAALLRGYAPDLAHWVPESPRPLLLTLGLIMVVGAVLQWLVFFRKSNK